VLRSKSNLRVVISLDLIMKSVAVEVDWDELEPIAIPVLCGPRKLSSTAVSGDNAGRISSQC